MKRLRLVLGALPLLLGCAMVPPPERAMTITTLNMLYDVACKPVPDADILLLQEVSDVQLRCLIEEDDRGMVWAEAPDTPEFIPILYDNSMFELTGQDFIPIPAPVSRLPRYVLLIKLIERSSGTAIQVANVHFDHVHLSARLHGVATLRDHLDPLLPAIIGGDFNMRLEPLGPWEVAARHWVDWILVNGVTTYSDRSVTIQESDHRAVSVEFQL